MAKRKRLEVSQIPASFDASDAASVIAPRPSLGSRLSHSAPPIAHIAADASAQAALGELTQSMQRAKQEGRLVQALALDTIDQSHLVRDRIVLDRDALDQLVASIKEHGQRTPIEVAALPDGRFGLISGWRRLQALQRLWQETGDRRFGVVLALQRQPETAVAAYVAMVEENEVRSGLSYYERARIAARATDLGVFDSEKRALQTLFAAASRARRSKIGSFLTIFRMLDATLRFPAAIPERLGLMLARRLEGDPDWSQAVTSALQQRPALTPNAELAQLHRLLANTVSAPQKPGAEVATGVFLKVSGNAAKPVLTLSGPGVGEDFKAALEAWLRLL